MVVVTANIKSFYVVWRVPAATNVVSAFCPFSILHLLCERKRFYHSLFFYSMWVREGLL